MLYKESDGGFRFLDIQRSMTAWQTYVADGIKWYNQNNCD